MSFNGILQFMDFDIDIFRDRVMSAVQKSSKSARAISLDAGFSSSFISDLNQGKVKTSPELKSVMALSTALDVPISYLTGESKFVPVVGVIPAGMPVEACQREMGTVLYSTARNDLYGLVVCGESMNEFISSGGIVVCEPFQGDLTAINNKVVHAEKDGGALDNDTTLKRYVHSIGALTPDSNTIDPDTNEPFESYRLSDGWDIKGVVIQKIEEV